MTAPASPILTRLDGPAPEVSISKDIIRRGAHRRPGAHRDLRSGLGLNGAWSALFAMGLVLVNFALAAAIVATTARISLGIMMGAVLFGYLIRLGLILVAVVLVKDAAWISRPALGTRHHRHALGAPRVGAQVPRHLARPPWAQALSSPPAKEHRAR